jgi:hypothetical protein
MPNHTILLARRTLRGGMLMLGALTFVRPAAAQSEEILRDAFEGRRVVIHFDLPATSRGLDVRPCTTRPVDFPALAKRYKRHGIALKSGDTVLVTKVKVKDDLIEFQLDGGGYGTFGDRVTEPGMDGPVFLGPSDEERLLSKAEKAERDPAKKREYREKLARARAERERTEVLATAVARQGEIDAERYRRERALMGGSRINLRFDRHVPESALTPDGLRALLQEYVTVLDGRAPGRIASADVD